jgi:hypothetical protein
MSPSSVKSRRRAPTPAAAAAAAAAGAAPVDSLPPFGDIPHELIEAIAGFPQPEGYDSLDGRPARVAWPGHYRRLVDRMAEAIWPRWGGFAGAPRWEGAAAQHMVELTELDLALTQVLQAEHSAPVRQRASGAAALGDAGKHSRYFQDEDPPEPDTDYPVLDYLLAQERIALHEAAEVLARALNQPVKEVGFAKRLKYWSFAHPTAPTLPSKREMQRPRPHQVASIKGIQFTRYSAPGAVTSALPSGHAIQGMMGVVGAVVELRPYFKFNAALLSRLRQYAVDVGDRRVFAGVHFPTDNLASWCLALSLCPHVYGAEGAFAQQFMAQAITGHSAVYAQLKAQNSPALAPGMAWLDELLQPLPGTSAARKRGSVKGKA